MNPKDLTPEELDVVIRAFQDHPNNPALKRAEGKCQLAYDAIDLARKRYEAAIVEATRAERELLAAAKGLGNEQ